MPDGQYSSIIDHEKRCFGIIQSLLSYSPGPLGIFIRNTHKMDDTEFQFRQSGPTTLLISYVQVTLSRSSQSGSCFQVSSRKQKSWLWTITETDDFHWTWVCPWLLLVLVIHSHFSYLFSSSHLPPSSLQSSFLSSAFCSVILPPKSHPIYLPIFHKQTYGI